jgi:hypothetical protein
MTKYEIAANIEIANLSSFEGKMSAAQQRAIFGGAWFGRKTIKIDNTNQGSVEVTWLVLMDQMWTCKSFAEIAQAANENRPFLSL